MSDVEVKIDVDKSSNNVYLDMNDTDGREVGMHLRVECSQHTEWHPTIYVYDNEDYEGDYIHSYTFPKQFGLEEVDNGDAHN